jgi:hypothetical protein
MGSGARQETAVHVVAAHSDGESCRLQFTCIVSMKCMRSDRGRPRLKVVLGMVIGRPDSYRNRTLHLKVEGRHSTRFSLEHLNTNTDPPNILFSVSVCLRYLHSSPLPLLPCLPPFLRPQPRCLVRRLSAFASLPLPR